MTSWVIVSKGTGNAVAETFLRNVAEAVNREKYDVLPVGEYLGGLNKRIKEGAA